MWGAAPRLGTDQLDLYIAARKRLKFKLALRELHRPSMGRFQ